MAEHGGYRKPSKPAAVSGPGALSQRTDGGPKMGQLADARYGEQADFQEIQRGAALGSPSPAPAAGGGGAPAVNPLQGLTGLGEPSTRPDVPVTDGADAGYGAGSDALGLPGADAKADAQFLKQYLPALVRQAQSANAPPGFKKYVRMLYAQS